MTVITALMLIGMAPRLHAAYDLTQLQELERLVMGRDCGALWSYLEQNPAILVGEDPLARELRGFVEANLRGQLNCYAALPATPPQSQAFAAVAQGAAY